uniref:Ribosomal protein S3 n=1 Tax=Cyanoptyche gloeocystis TaxID=77922 RepID=A0A096Y6X6_9EUKA|nr:ribosomal protein S3 [Cyanoptyche gloeocystis]AIM52072.1 ribosomal protein S3 [Cyanoptyche gloeocystis]
MGQKVNSNLIRRDINQNFKFLSSNFNKFKKLNELIVVYNIILAVSTKYNIQFNDLCIYISFKDVKINYSVSKLINKRTLKKKSYYYIKWSVLKKQIKEKLHYKRIKYKKTNKVNISNKYIIINKILASYLKNALMRNVSISYFIPPIAINNDLIVNNIANSIKKLRGGYKNIFRIKNIFKNYDLQLKKKFNNYILGYKIILRGRINSSKKASEMQIVKGRMPLQTFKQHILTKNKAIITKRGSIGLKLWILYSISNKLKKLSFKTFKSVPSLPYSKVLITFSNVLHKTICYKSSIYRKFTRSLKLKKVRYNKIRKKQYNYEKKSEKVKI